MFFTTSLAFCSLAKRRRICFCILTRQRFLSLRLFGFLPDINLTSAVSTSKDLSTAVKLRISQLRFGRFKERLSQTASVYGTDILTGSEAFTSKQCGKCGELNNKLGKSETWHCPSCGCEADRDGHAARNIFLRFLTSAPAA